MNITNVHPYADLQDFVRPESGKNSAQEIRREATSPLEISDPPFFPIATYQRMDLIRRSDHPFGDKLGQTEADRGINIPAESTRDLENGHAIRKISMSGPENIRPGAILHIKA